MKNISHEGVVDAAAILDNTDELLANLDLATEADVEADTDEDVLSALSELTIEDEAAIEIAAETADAYQEQEVSSAGVSEPEVTETAAEKPAKVKKVRAAAAPKAPKDLASIDAAVFDLGNGLDKAAVIKLRPNQKKIAEKFDNLFQKVSVGAAPSTYIMSALAMLDTHGEATSADLIAGMKASNSRAGTPYNQGTAASQVGQIMSLFSVVGIAKRDGQKLTLNRESPLTVKLLAIAA